MRRTLAGGQRQRRRVDVTRMLSWQQDRGAGWRYVAPYKPVQNAFAESLISKLRDKCLTEHVFVE